MPETARIRWKANEDGNAYTAAFRGYAGTSDAVNFAIYPPTGRVREWVLRSDLPGQDRYRTGSDGPDDLKRHAERWLVEFVSSLGAVFPDNRFAFPCDDEDDGEPLEAKYAPGIADEDEQEG